MNTYEEFVKHTAEQTRGYVDRFDMANAVFEAVCGADPDELREHIHFSDDWANSGEYNNSWTATYCPDFQDPSALGDWEGFDLSSLQEFLQDVLNHVDTKNEK